MPRLACLVLAGLTFAGCYDPALPDGAITCGAAGECPQGFSCQARKCVREGSTIDLALGTFRGNGKLGPLDLSMAMSGEFVSLNIDTGKITVDVRQANGTLMTRLTVLGDNVDGFERVAQQDGPPGGLWNFTTVMVPPGVTLLHATAAKRGVIALAASDNMTIAGNIDLRSAGGFLAQPGMPGGTVGLPMNTMPARPGVGDGAGGGGGGHGFAGSAGKAQGGVATGGGQGGDAYGQATVDVVYAGSGGAGGRGTMGAPMGMGGRGGAGGGAIALLSRRVTISGTIDVGGAPGATGTDNGGGGGGGSGGTILISGDEVVFNTGHSLTATGGTGGKGAGSGPTAGGDGGDGSEGRVWVGSPQLTVVGGGRPTSTPQVTTTTTAVDRFPRRPAM
jgi:hypothetical protein